MTVKPIQFLEQVKQEANKVTWSSRKEVLTTTTVVLVMIVIAALFFMVVDLGISYIVKLLLGIGK